MLDIGAIRLDFPILQKRINGEQLAYLDNAATAQKPAAVIQAIVDFYQSSNGNAGRSGHYLSGEAAGIYESARETVRRFINAPKPQEIIFTAGTTEAINLVADSYGAAFVKPGDEIVISAMEHHSNIVPWQRLCQRKGCVLKVAPLTGKCDLDLDALAALITPRTKIVAVTYVSNVLGGINPVREITRLAHSQGAAVLIDGAQAIQHLPVDVCEIDCDFFAFSAHKLYAPTGTGVLYGKEKWLEDMPVYESGGGMVRQVSFSQTVFASPPLKFEAGTSNVAGAAGLKAAIDYINGLGLNRIATYEKGLLQFALRRLDTVDGLHVFGEPQCGLVSFDLTGVHPYDAGDVLDKLGIAVRTGTLCAEPLMRHLGVSGTIRASLAFYNTEEEIERLVAGLKKARELFGNGL